MKKYFIATVFFSLVIAPAQKTSGKVVISSTGEEVGRYVGEDNTRYHIEVQDEGWIPKKGHKVVLYTAEKVKGVVFPKNWGTLNIRKSPNISSQIVGKLTYPEGELPDVVECLTVKNGWYKIRFQEKTGYVKANLVSWDSINSF